MVADSATAAVWAGAWADGVTTVAGAMDLAALVLGVVMVVLQLAGRVLLKGAHLTPTATVVTIHQTRAPHRRLKATTNRKGQ